MGESKWYRIRPLAQYCAVKHQISSGEFSHIEYQFVIYNRNICHSICYSLSHVICTRNNTVQPLNVFRYVTSETFSLKFSWLQSTGELLSWPTLDLWNFVQCCGGIILHIEKETLNLWTNRTCYVGPIFNWLLKVIRDLIDFALLCSVTGPEYSRHHLNQSDAKLKPNATCPLAFSRALDRILVFAVSCHQLASCDIFPRSDWLLWLLWFWFYDSQLKSAVGRSN